MFRIVSPFAKQSYKHKNQSHIRKDNGGGGGGHKATCWFTGDYGKLCTIHRPGPMVLMEDDSG